jgi:hypothetical protein
MKISIAPGYCWATEKIVVSDGRRLRWGTVWRIVPVDQYRRHPSKAPPEIFYLLDFRKSLRKVRGAMRNIIIGAYYVRKDGKGFTVVYCDLVGKGC